jgi:hypothetical protein
VPIDRIDQVIDALFRIPIRFSDDSLAFATAVYSLVLVFHALLGSAEIVTGADCRFLNPKFWFRILFFGFLIAGFDPVVIPFARKIAVLSFDQFVVSYNEGWKHWIDATDQVLGHAFRQQDAEFSVLNLPALVTANFMDALATLIGTVLTFILGGLIMLLTLVMGFVGLGLSAGTLALAPIALVFGAFEATEAVALSYLKTFLVYCVLYLPLLALAMEIAVSLQTAVNGLAVHLSLKDAIGSFTEHLFTMVAAPLAGFAVVLSVPSLTSRLFH